MNNLNNFTRICPNCGRLYEDEDNFCNECVGLRLVTITKECPICGRFFKEEDNFCDHCVSIKLIPKGENKNSYPQYKIVKINDLIYIKYNRKLIELNSSKPPEEIPYLKLKNDYMGLDGEDEEDINSKIKYFNEVLIQFKDISKEIDGVYESFDAKIDSLQGKNEFKDLKIKSNNLLEKFDSLWNIKLLTDYSQSVCDFIDKANKFQEFTRFFDEIRKNKLDELVFSQINNNKKDIDNYLHDWEILNKKRITDYKKSNFKNKYEVLVNRMRGLNNLDGIKDENDILKVYVPKIKAMLEIDANMDALVNENNNLHDSLKDSRMKLNKMSNDINKFYNELYCDDTFFIGDYNDLLEKYSRLIDVSSDLSQFDMLLEYDSRVKGQLHKIFQFNNFIENIDEKVKEYNLGQIQNLKSQTDTFQKDFESLISKSRSEDEIKDFKVSIEEYNLFDNLDDLESLDREEYDISEDFESTIIEIRNVNSNIDVLIEKSNSYNKKKNNL